MSFNLQFKVIERDEFWRMKTMLTPQEILKIANSREENEDNRLTVNEILEIAQKYIDKYEVVAIRSQFEEFSLGPIDHKSSVWDDGDETDEKLNGISATSIRSYNVKAHSSEWDWQSGWYSGDHQAIICGDRYEMGQDDGEVVIEDPVVVEIIK